MTTTITEDMAEVTEGLQSAGDVVAKAVASGFTVLAEHMDAMRGDIAAIKGDVCEVKGDLKAFTKETRKALADMQASIEKIEEHLPL